MFSVLWILANRHTQDYANLTNDIKIIQQFGSFATKSIMNIITTRIASVDRF